MSTSFYYETTQKFQSSYINYELTSVGYAAVYRSIKQYPQAVQQKGMVIMRVDAPIYFANVQHIRHKLEAYLTEGRADPNLQPIVFVILDLSPVPFIDATGAPQ